MKRFEAIKQVISSLDNELVIHANGMISRESFMLGDRPTNFYMLGSMGLASAIGLGLAVNRPDRKVIVLDGDGNVLMGLATLAMVGEMRPTNFLHIVLDNEVYGSTGGQRTISSQMPLERIARAAGYSCVARVEIGQQLTATLMELLKAEGPSFLLIKVDPENLEGVGRVSHPPEAIAQRFARSVVTNG